LHIVVRLKETAMQSRRFTQHVINRKIENSSWHVLEDTCFSAKPQKLGSAVLVINSAGLVIENNRTLPYGEAWQAENTPSTNDKKFTTYLRDSESGLDYAGARYLANNYGRFVSSDPGPMNPAQPISLNRYVYVGNDPVNFHDPSGRSFCPAEFSYSACGGDAEFWGGDFGGEHAMSSPWMYGMLPGRFATEIMAGLQAYIQNMNLGFATAAAGNRARRAPCEQDAVRNTIEAYAANSGIQFAGYDFNRVTVAGLTSTDETLDGLTELFLDASSPQSWADLQRTLIANGFLYAGYDPLHGDYTQSYRQRTANGQWSIQVSYNAAGNIQVDIDPHNPMQSPIGHAMEVIANTLTGSDTNYHTVAGNVGVADNPCPQ
jgi:RHS repeat-associated protein